MDETGRKIQDVCRDRQISEQTFHRWKREFGMMEVDQAKQLKEFLLRISFLGPGFQAAEEPGLVGVQGV